VILGRIGKWLDENFGDGSSKPVPLARMVPEKRPTNQEIIQRTNRREVNDAEIRQAISRVTHSRRIPLHRNTQK
jgi:hypothetical protein